MRLIAERLLHDAARGNCYLRGELSLTRLSLRGPLAGRHHVFCSANNAGASALICEVQEALGVRVAESSNADELHQCDHVLLYLNGLTWTSGETSDALAAEVRRAMDLGVPLLLAHEMPGAVGADADRHSVDFASFFACDLGATPPDLLNRGCYHTIAIALKGGAWRRAGLVMVAQGVGTEVGCDMGGMAVRLGSRGDVSRVIRGWCAALRSRWCGPRGLPDEYGDAVELELRAPSAKV